MQRYEYKVVPAPDRGEKVKGLKKSDERFAHTLTAAINALAAEGWEYHRAEILPCAERKGLTGTTTIYHNLLVFRRPLPAAAAPATEEAEPQPAAVADPPAPAPTSAAAPEALPEPPQPSPPVRLASWSPRKEPAPTEAAGPSLRAARQDPPAPGRPVLLGDSEGAPRLRWPLRTTGKEDGGASS